MTDTIEILQETLKKAEERRDRAEALCVQQCYEKCENYAKSHEDQENIQMIDPSPLLPGLGEEYVSCIEGWFFSYIQDKEVKDPEGGPTVHFIIEYAYAKPAGTDRPYELVKVVTTQNKSGTVRNQFATRMPPDEIVSTWPDIVASFEKSA